MYIFAIVYILLLKGKKMGYKVKIQKVDRGNTKSFYVNFPAAVAEAAQIVKVEEMEWEIEDRNIFVLKRIKQKKSITKKNKKA